MSFAGLELSAGKIAAAGLFDDSMPSGTSIIVHDWQWRPQEVRIDTAMEFVRYLGVDVNLMERDHRSLARAEESIFPPPVATCLHAELPPAASLRYF
jgi:hypothetical protein